MPRGICGVERGIVDVNQGIDVVERGIVDVQRGIVTVQWGTVTVAWGIVVVKQSAFHSAEDPEKPAEPAKKKGVAGLGFDESPGVAGAALRLATNAFERSTATKSRRGIFEVDVRSSIDALGDGSASTAGALPPISPAEAGALALTMILKKYRLSEVEMAERDRTMQKVDRLGSQGQNRLTKDPGA